MNILLLTADADRTAVAFCIAHGPVYCALAGEVTAANGHAAVSLRDPLDHQLHNAVVPCPSVLGADRAAAVLVALNWLRERRIRVDLVVHRVAHHGASAHVLRLTQERIIDRLAGFPACQPAVYCMDAVAKIDPALPQVVFFGVRPQTVESVAEAVLAAGMHPPASCPKKMKVRCESCTA